MPMPNFLLTKPPGKLLFALLLGLCSALPVRAAYAQEISEYGMKAVLFYRLAQFVYWPGGEAAPKPTVLCVVGKNPFASSALQLRQGSNEQIEMRVAPSDLNGCHLLFIARSESGNLDSWLTRLEGKRVITVSDIPGFAKAGGMIELPLEGDDVGILINRGSAAKKGLDFNAQLLRLAKTVTP